MSEGLHDPLYVAPHRIVVFHQENRRLPGFAGALMETDWGVDLPQYRGQEDVEAIGHNPRIVKSGEDFLGAGLSGEDEGDDQ